jgi:hypothetical protein
MSGASKRRRKKRAWFREGAEVVRGLGLADHIKALVRVTKNAVLVNEDGTVVEDFYICPLCTIVLTPGHLDHEQVTLEHVPPASMQGREMVLTCKECNNEDGSKLDSQLLSLEEAIDFGRGTMQRATKGKVSIGEHSLNAEIHSTGNSILIFMDERRNNPTDHRAAVQSMEDMVGSERWNEFTMTLSLPGFRFNQARMSLLRAGYLTAFAALGYNYVFHPELRRVREQLRNPDSEILRGFLVSDPSQPRVGTSLIWAREPDWLDALLVRMGRHTVVLPGLGNPSGFYDRLGDHLSAVGQDGKLNIKISGKQLPWPTSPTYALDRSA